MEIPRTLSISHVVGLMLLLSLIVMERSVWDFGPNIELITLGSLLISSSLGRKWGGIFTLASLVITDLLIGNTAIFLFTWTGFLIPILFFSPRFFTGQALGKKVALGLGLGLSANLFFYLWTNGGVWLLDRWGMYPDTLAGLLQSYVAGLPFLKQQLMSTLVFIPLGFVLTSLAAKALQPGKKLFVLFVGIIRPSRERFLG